MNKTTLGGVRRLGFGLVAGTVALLLVAMPANAHSTLVSSSPADGSTLGAAPTQVVLTFNENIVTVGDQVVVTSPSGILVNEGNPSVVDATVTEALRPLTENGTYLINYRIVSADGHPVQRQLSFTLNVAGLASASPATPSASPAPKPSGGSSSTWVIVVGAALVGLVIGLAATLLGRRRGAGRSTGTASDGTEQGNPPGDDLVD